MTAPGRPDASRTVLLVACGLSFTLVLHGVLVASLYGGRARADHVAPPQHFGQVVDVQAVKFGRPRDLSFLPHKEAPPAQKPQPRLALTANEHALPRLRDPSEPEPRAPDPLKNVHHFDNPAADPASTGTAVEEGDPNGLRGGTATVGKGPIYFQHLVAAVQNAWSVPTSFNDAQLHRLQAQACIKIDVEGRITEYAISVPSGNQRFDDTLLDALAQIRQFEPPTTERLSPGGPTVREVVTGDGVCLNFQKSREP